MVCTLIMQFHLSWTLLNFIVTSKCWYRYPNFIYFPFKEKRRRRLKNEQIMVVKLWQRQIFSNILKWINEIQNPNGDTPHTHLSECIKLTVCNIINNLKRSVLHRSTQVLHSPSLLHFNWWQPLTSVIMVGHSYVRSVLSIEIYGPKAILFIHIFRHYSWFFSFWKPQKKRPNTVATGSRSEKKVNI